MQKRFLDDFSGNLCLFGLFLGGANLDLHHEPFGFLFNLDFEVSAGEGLHEVLEPLGHGHVEPFVLVDPLPVQVLLLGDAVVNPVFPERTGHLPMVRFFPGFFRM